MIHTPSVCAVLSRLGILAGVSFLTAAAQAADGVTVKEEKGKVRVEINGQLFTEYHFEGARRPYFYPVIGPGGAGMTRNWPLKEDVAGEEKDHPHHTGLWYGHRHVNGVGFWENTGKADARLGKIVHDKFLQLGGGKDAGTIQERNNWIADDGELVLTEERTIRIYNRKNARLLDFDITFQAGKKDVVFGDDKDGAMATRVPEVMRVEKAKQKGEKKAAAGDGHLVTSEGKRDAEAWGTRAKWCDYFGPVEGKTVGVAIFDHPNNPRYPTWWHARSYGLFAANPFGQAQFEKLPDKKAGDFKIPAGQSATFRYRLFWHEGDEKQASVEDQYKQYVFQTTSKAPAKSAPKAKSK